MGTRRACVYPLAVALVSVLVLFSTDAAVRDVATFGADPTGQSDSYSAISDAHDASGSGDTVYFPNGTYMIGIVQDCEFRENYGVAVDFDKGAMYCSAIGNEIYDMKPTQQYATGPMWALSCADGGGTGTTVASTHNRFEDNKLKQSNIPYTKFRNRDGYACKVINNEILEGDLGGEAFKHTYTTSRGGSASDTTLVQGNIFPGGDIILGGSEGGPRIDERIVFRGNQINGTIQMFSKQFAHIAFTGANAIDFGDSDNPWMKAASNTTVDTLIIDSTIFAGSGRTIQLTSPFTYVEITGSSFEGMGEIQVSPSGAALVEGNLFKEMSGATVLTGSTPSFDLLSNRFCGCLSSDLFRLTNCSSLRLVDNRQAGSTSVSYSTSGSAVTEETGNWWQGVPDAECGVSGSIRQDNLSGLCPGRRIDGPGSMVYDITGRHSTRVPRRPDGVLVTVTPSGVVSRKVQME